MVVKALFIGSNSLGYEKNKEYILNLFQVKNGLIIHRKEKKGICKYSSLKAFLENWSNVNLL